MIRLFGVDIFPATTTKSHFQEVAESSNSPFSVLGRQESPATSSTSSSSGGDKKRRSPSSSSELRNEGKKKRHVREKYAQVPTAELSSEFQEMIGNRPVFFVYRKKLTPTDVDNCKQKNDDEEEERKAFVVGGVNVDVIGAIDSSGREYELRLSKWRKDKKTSVFNEQWRQIFADNGAKAGDWVDLWCFDRWDEPKYCLAVNFITT